MTLEEAGRTCGVTRERVRQVESKFIRALPGSFYVPQVERALRLLEQACPLSIVGHYRQGQEWILKVPLRKVIC